MTSRTKKISKKTGKIRVEDILRRVDRLPKLSSCTADEILDYDRDGIPQSGGPQVGATARRPRS
jgi:hypothetical protein